VNHGLALTFRILVDFDLPELVFSSEFGLPIRPQPMVDDKTSGRVYRCYECRIPRAMVDAKSEFKVRINRKSRV
jgi:hypothetical protein